MSSRWIPGRFPDPGTSRIADIIRERRGARGLTDLDGALLHVPPVAEGWNTLLGAIRTKGHLPGNVRELMILRVAALNGAAYEWVHHEHVGRDNGLTTAQLTAIRSTTSTPKPGVLSPLQLAALAFADASTKLVQVPETVMGELKVRIEELVTGEDHVQDWLVEVAAVVSIYNMVSRFLVSLDVAGKSNTIVPWPADRQQYTVPIPDTTDQHLHVVTLTVGPDSPYVILINSLLSNYSMWDPIIPHLLSASYNLILYDQRGHGQSSVPNPPITSMGTAASDVATILSYLSLPRVAAVIGVSQGGATALNVIRLYPRLVDRAIVCDTQAIGPQANIQAWDDRIATANASPEGMHVLARATVKRWFPPGSPLADDDKRQQPVIDMVAATDKLGFEAGARALQGYNLIEPGQREGGGPSLLECKVPTLLVAGTLDGGGAIANGLVSLRDTWSAQGGKVTYAAIEGCGHLPMIDGPELFWKAVNRYLST